MSERTIRPSKASEQAGLSSPRRFWPRSVAVGLGVGGMAAAAVGSLTPVRPGRPQFPVVLLIGAAALAAILLFAATRWILKLRSSSTAVQDRPTFLRSALAVAAAVGLVVTALAWREVFADLEGGLLTRALPLFASGSSLLAIGCVLLVGTCRHHPSVRRAGRKRGSAVAVAALTAVAGAVAAAASAVAVERAPVDAATFHSTDTAPARPSKPVVPDRAIWQWEAPAGTIVDPDDIAAIPHGVVVQVKDGVLALDAKTGEELWHHRISGAGVLNSASTPSGDLVLVEFATGNDVAPDDAGSLMVALDGRTGEVLSRYVFEELSPMRAQRKEGLDAFGLTDDVFVTGRLQDGLVAHALPYGDPLWKWSTMPEGCESASLDSTFDVIGSAVLIPLACDGKGGSHQIRLIALDATTGRELWRYSSLVPGSLDTPLTVVPSPDGTAAFFRWRWEGDDAGSRSVVLDLETGDELLPPTDGYGYSDLRVARNALMVIDSSGGLTWTPYDGGEPLHMTATCGELPWEAGHHESRVSNSEALVQVCVPDGAKAARVAVLPWRSPREGHTFEVDLAPGTAESQWHDGPHLLEFPELMLVVPDSGDRDRITALR